MPGTVLALTSDRDRRQRRVPRRHPGTGRLRRRRPRRDARPLRARRLRLGRPPRARRSPSSTRSPTTFSLHPLAVEDAVKAHQRPKLERYDDTLFLVVKTLWYVDAEDAVETGEINLFVGPDFVISVRHGEGGGLQQARLDLEAREAVLAHGPSAVVYAVCDQVVDGYEHVTDALVEDVDEVELSVFSETRTNDSARIYVLKRELAEVRRAVLPLRDPIGRFANGTVHGIDREAAPYFRDVGDHLAADRRHRRRARQPALHRVRGAPGPDLGPAERGHAQDLRRRRAGRGPDPDRRHLRHELRPHARAPLAVRLPRGRCCSWSAPRPACCGSSSAPAGS